jgi:hypothetical protein
MSSPFWSANNVRFVEGVDEQEINRFTNSFGGTKDLKAGQYFDNGNYMVVAGNAAEAGWGAHVPPGYEKIGFTTEQTWQSHPKYGNSKKTYGDNLLILKRSQAKPPETQAQQLPQAEPEPVVRQPSDDLANARKRWDNDQNSVGMGNAPGSIHFNPTGNPYADAANYGNAATDDYQRRFIPSLNRQSELEAREIGETGNFHLSRFAGKVPELGDPKEMFEYYKNKIG